MYQQGNSQFIDLLNQVRVGNLDKNNIAILESKIINSYIEVYPTSALHIYAENE